MLEIINKNARTWSLKKHRKRDKLLVNRGNWLAEEGSGWEIYFKKLKINY